MIIPPEVFSVNEMQYDKCMKRNTKALSDRLHQARRDMRLDQAELAELSGVSRGYISEIERGAKTNVGVDVVFLLAEALGVTVPYLLGLSDDALGEGNDRVLKEQSNRYVIVEVENSEQRQAIQKLIDEYLTLSPRGQRQVLRIVRSIQEVEAEMNSDNPGHQSYDEGISSVLSKLDKDAQRALSGLIEMYIRNTESGTSLPDLHRLLKTIK